MLVLLVLSFYVSLCYLSEVEFGEFRIISSFVIFIIGEAIVFASLLLGVMWYNSFDNAKLSYWCEIPLIGTFMLSVSSVTVAAYHHSMSTSWGRF